MKVAIAHPSPPSLGAGSGPRLKGGAAQSIARAAGGGEGFEARDGVADAAPTHRPLTTTAATVALPSEIEADPLCARPDR
jgi:hypothetical protein